MRQTNQLAVWDVTLSVNKSSENHTEIIKELDELGCKRWIFQLEDSSLARSDDDDWITGSEESDEEESEHYSCDSDSDSDGGVFIDLNDIDENDCPDLDVEFSDEYESDTTLESDSSDEEEGYMHWQIKLSLSKKKRLSSILALLKCNHMMLQKGHWSPSSTPSLGEQFFNSYAGKLDTRVRGPWRSDSREVPIPNQIAHITSLYSWQQEVIDRAMYGDDFRCVNIIIDKDGCKGKSVLSLYCKAHKIMDCRLIPCITGGNQVFLDLNQAVLSQPIGRLYFCDMPRALPKNKLAEFFSFLETLKNGYVWDKRFCFKERLFNSPAVWVFMNVEPDLKLLTNNRWRLWAIRDDEELVDYRTMCKSDIPIDYPREEVVEEEETEAGEECPPCISEEDDPSSPSVDALVHDDDDSY
jgi:hypothetical protein